MICRIMMYQVGIFLSEDLHDKILDDESTDDEIAADSDFAESVGHVTDMNAITHVQSHRWAN